MQSPVVLNRQLRTREALKCDRVAFHRSVGSNDGNDGERDAGGVLLSFRFFRFELRQNGVAVPADFILNVLMLEIFVSSLA